MEHNFHSKETESKGTVPKKNHWERKIPRASVNTVITHQNDLWSPKSY